VCVCVCMYISNPPSDRRAATTEDWRGTPPAPSSARVNPSTVKHVPGYRVCSCKMINRSHAHAHASRTHDSRTNHSHEHRASNGETTLNSRRVSSCEQPASLRERHAASSKRVNLTPAKLKPCRARADSLNARCVYVNGV